MRLAPVILTLSAALVATASCTEPSTEVDDEAAPRRCELDGDCTEGEFCVGDICIDPEEEVCIAPYERCSTNAQCCGNSLCITYTFESTAISGCEVPCEQNRDCTSNCCVGVGNTGGATCSPSVVCEGAGQASGGGGGT
ncbi:MAG: hypothetical protein AAGA56_25645 [Myxococcota bacterium]